jgi:hypothetical protein
MIFWDHESCKEFTLTKEDGSGNRHIEYRGFCCDETSLGMANAIAVQGLRHSLSDNIYGL